VNASPTGMMWSALQSTPTQSTASPAAATGATAAVPAASASEGNAPPLIESMKQTTQVAPSESAQPATADLERRVRELESRLGTVEGGAPAKNPNAAGSPADANALPNLPSGGVNLPFTSGWDRNNGFFIGSPDGQNRLRLTGQIQADYRSFYDRGDTEDIDTFFLRRARFGLEATVFQFHEFRFLTDFGANYLNGATTTTATPRIVDAYYNMHYWECFQVEAGKFKQPFSYEELIQDRFTPLLERSLIDQLVPQRDVGVMLHGEKLLDDRVDWAVAVANGEQNGDTDTNSLKDYAFRLVVRPFKTLSPLIEGLQLGMSYTTGIEQESVSNFLLRTPAGIPFFHFLSDVRAEGLRNRWCPEFAYFYQGFGLVGQWFHMEQQFDTPDGKHNILVPFDGYFVMATYLLTGETRTTYSKTVEPLQPFDPRGDTFGIGAWELTTRVSRLHLSDDVFFPVKDALANPVGLSNGATEFTNGFNWYLNGFVRVQFNWEHSWFDRPVKLGSTKFYSQDNALMTRLQIQF
jgi:phosphate-selective porin OprO and OprP